MNCPQCRHNNPEGAKFCNNCASEITLKCLECGTELDAEDRFCYACGKPVEQTPESQPEAPAVATEQPTIESDKEPKDSPDYYPMYLSDDEPSEVESEPEPKPEPEATNMSEEKPVEIEVEPEEITESEDQKKPEPATGLKYLRAHTKSPEELRKQPKLGAHAAHAKAIKELRKQPKEELRKQPKLGAHSAHAKALEEIRAERIKMPATTSPNPLNPKYPLSKPTVIRPIIRRPIVKQSVEVYERAQRKRIAIIIFSIIIALVVLIILVRACSTPLKETQYFKTVDEQMPSIEMFATSNINTEHPPSNIERVRNFRENIAPLFGYTYEKNKPSTMTTAPKEYNGFHFEFLRSIDDWLSNVPIALSGLRESQDFWWEREQLNPIRSMHVGQDLDAPYLPLSCEHVEELTTFSYSKRGAPSPGYSSGAYETKTACHELKKLEQEIERLYLRFYAIADVEVSKVDLRGYTVITIP